MMWSRRSKRHLQSPILTAQEQDCLQVPGPKSDPSTAILQTYLKNRELQFKHRTSASHRLYCARCQPEHGCRFGRRGHPNWQIAGELLCVVRNSLLRPNGVSEWVWQACASRETIGDGQPFSLSSKGCR